MPKVAPPRKVTLETEAGSPTAKPVLVLVNNYGYGFDADNVTVQRFLQILMRLGLSFVVRDVTETIADETIYEACVLVWADATAAACKPWMRGDKLIPVVCISCCYYGCATATNCETGADTGYDTSSKGSPQRYPDSGTYIHFTDGVGRRIYSEAGRGGSADVDAAHGESIFDLTYGGYTTSGIWRLKARADLSEPLAPVWYSEMTLMPHIWLLMLFQAANIWPSGGAGFLIRVDIDDIQGISPAGLPGLAAAVDWFREKGIAAIVGLDTTLASSTWEAAATRAAIQAASDVLKPIPHFHTPDLMASTDPPDTILATWTDHVGYLKARGYAEAEKHYRGHLYTGLNHLSYTAAQAAAKAGVKLVRTTVPASGPAITGGEPGVFIYREPGGPDYRMSLIGSNCWAGVTTKYNKAGMIAYHGYGTNEERHHMNLQYAYFCEQLIRLNQPCHITHGVNYNDTSALAVWEATHAYAVGDMVQPTDWQDDGFVGFYYICTTAGTTAGTEPTWPTASGQGSYVTDGTVVWQHAGYNQGCEDLGHAGENVALWQLLVLDYLIQFYNGWIRWAGEQDLIRMAS